MSFSTLIQLNLFTNMWLPNRCTERMIYHIATCNDINTSLLQADKDKEKVASIIAKALQHQGGSNENLADGSVPISSSTPSSENATLTMHTMPIELSIHFERADKGLGLSIAGIYKKNIYIIHV